MFSLRMIARTVSALAAACTLLVSAAPASAQVRCCDPWDNGLFDGTGAQTSQRGFGADWRNLARVSFDDFWLCEGQVYRTHTVRGTICTDSVVPKVTVVIVKDCDGQPVVSESGLVAIADSVPIDTTGAPAGYECMVGTVSLTETGRTTPEGFRIIDVEANFPKLWLKGGSYWISFIGYSGTADPDEQFFWGFAGRHVIKGRPGVFFNSDDNTITDIDELCCGCTDFAFCIEAEKCKVLLDNGQPDLNLRAPSLANPGSVYRESRAADDVPIAACHDRRLCFVEGYLLTNCDPPTARLDIYDNDCRLPATFGQPFTFNSRCVIDTGIAIASMGSRPLRLYRVQFWDLRAMDGSPFVLQQNKNYWFSIFAVGNGSQTQQGYFVGAQRCDLNCNGRTIHFNPAAVSGLGLGLIDHRWVSTGTYFSQPFDLAMLVATDDDTLQSPPPAEGPACASDINHDGVLSLQDLFDFLAAFFAGCP